MVNVLLNLSVQLKMKEEESLKLVTYVLGVDSIMFGLGSGFVECGIAKQTLCKENLWLTRQHSCLLQGLLFLLPLSTLQFTLYNTTASARLLYYPIFAAEVFLLLGS